MHLVCKKSAGDTIAATTPDMKTTAVATTLSLLAALLLTLSLALACGGDDGEVNATSSPGGGNTAGSNGDGDSFSGYFADLQRIFEDADAATNDAEEPLNETSSEAELDARLSALDTYLGEIDTIFSEAIGRLETDRGPEPPPPRCAARRARRPGSPR